MLSLLDLHKHVKNSMNNLQRKLYRKRDETKATPSFAELKRQKVIASISTTNKRNYLIINNNEKNKLEQRTPQSRWKHQSVWMFVWEILVWSCVQQQKRTKLKRPSLCSLFMYAHFLIVVASSTRCLYKILRRRHNVLMTFFCCTSLNGV